MIAIIYLHILLSIGGLIDSLDGETLVALCTGIGALVTGYVLMKEKLVKNELKTENILSYIDSKVELLTMEMNKMKEDIVDFKEINKETSKSLTENTSAVRELKIVLNMLKIQLLKENNKNIINDLDDL